MTASVQSGPQFDERRTTMLKMPATSLAELEALAESGEGYAKELMEVFRKKGVADGSYPHCITAGPTGIKRCLFRGTLSVPLTEKSMLEKDYQKLLEPKHGRRGHKKGFVIEWLQTVTFAR
jgi:hypothetical protein